MIWLENELIQESDLLQQGFDFLDKCTGKFERLGNLESETLVEKFSRICAITLAKANHFLIGCYSLTLDGLAQEAGAILRPFIETYELLVYFRLNPARVDEAIDEKLPTAGKVSQHILGNYKDLRAHLNDNASHFSYRIDSVRHLFDHDLKLKSFPTHSLSVLRANLMLLNAFQVFIIFEAINCLFTIGVDVNTFADEVETWKKKSLSVFPKQSLGN